MPIQLPLLLRSGELLRLDDPLSDRLLEELPSARFGEPLRAVLAGVEFADAPDAAELKEASVEMDPLRFLLRRLLESTVRDGDGEEKVREKEEMEWASDCGKRSEDVSSEVDRASCRSV